MNYEKTCTRYTEELNEMSNELDLLDIKMFHVNHGSTDDHKKWMYRIDSKYDHISDTDQKISKSYCAIVTHPKHPSVSRFANHEFFLIGNGLKIKYIWKAERSIHTIPADELLTQLRSALE